MSQAPAGTLLRHVHKLLAAQDSHAAPDQVLLQRFVAGREEAAFAALVQRHGPLVLGVCRRVLGHDQDAEDAFQATFLVLARRAGSIRKQDALASWLYGVAYRIAAKARVRAAQRRAGERCPPDRSCTEPGDAVTWGELRLALDEELRRLPEKYRAPLVLCYLDGKTQDEAARQLGWTPGSVKGRLERARLLLRGRLIRRGITLSAALLGAALGEKAASAAAVPALLAAATTRAGLAFAAGTEAAAAGVPAQAAALAEGAVNAVAASHAKLGLVLLLTVTAAVASAGALARQVPAAKPPAARQEAVPAAPPEAGREQPPEQARQRADRYGDPLPEGAVARLGTLRLRHGGMVGFVRFTPDGTVLVAQGWQDGIRTWDVATGKQIGALPKEATEWGFGAAALAPDGKRLATASDAGIHLWEVPGCKEVATFGPHPYFRVCFSPDGKFLAALRLDQKEQVDLLDASTGRPVWSCRAKGLPLGCVAFTADSKAVAVAGLCEIRGPAFKENAVRFVDVASGQEQRRIDLGTDTPEKISLSPDGRLLAVFCYALDKSRLKGFIRVWELAGGKERFRLEPPAKEDYGRIKTFTALAFTDDGKSLLTAGDEDGLVVWDMATGKERRSFGRRVTNAHDLAMAPDGRAVAVGHPGGWVRMIDWISGKDLLPGGDYVLGFCRTAMTPDSRTVVTTDLWGLRLWDPATGRERARFDTEEAGFLDNWAAVTRDGSTAFFENHRQKAVILYDTTTGKQRFRLSLDSVGQEPRVKGIAPGGEILAAGTYNGDTLHLVDCATGKTLRTLHDPGRRLMGVEFPAGGRTLVAYRDNYTAQMWDVTTGARLREFKLTGQVGPVSSENWRLPRATALSPEGKWLAYCSMWDGLLVVIDTATGEEAYRLSTLPGSPCSLLKFSDDSRILAWGGDHGSAIHLLEVATGKERQTLTGHRGPVRVLGFSADGKTLVSASDDTTALVWDLTGQAVSGKPPASADPDGCWAALAADDAARAYKAEWKLAASPDRTVSHLATRLHPAAPVDEKRVAAWIADLNSDQFAVRDHASRELEKLGPAAAPACREALRHATSAEARHRLEALLDRQAQEQRTPSGESLRALRALEVLERIGTPAARQILEPLAKGVPEARLTQEAKATLQRLTKSAAR